MTSSIARDRPAKRASRVVNTDISIPARFFEVANRADLIAESLVVESAYPLHWNWADDSYTNNEDVVDAEWVAKTKTMIHKPYSQRLCGNCWAFAVSSMLSDTLAISGLVTNERDARVAVTAIMNLVPQLGCGGGGAFFVIDTLYDRQIPFPAGGKCTSYSWCTRNDLCTARDSTYHFQSVEEQYAELNKLIPSSSWCLNAQLFNVETIAAVGDANERLESVHRMKQHIRYRGTIIGNLFIYKNFLNGKFTQCRQTDGVYLETVDYESTLRTDTLVEYPNKLGDDDIVGGHSVVVVGWGVTKLTMVGGVVRNVSYWICRNSWGRKWGDNGYFKIAMAPFNKRTSIGNKTTGFINNNRTIMGGAFFVTLKPTWNSGILNQQMYYANTQSPYLSLRISNDNVQSVDQSQVLDVIKMSAKETFMETDHRNTEDDYGNTNSTWLLLVLAAVGAAFLLVTPANRDTYAPAAARRRR